MNFVVENVIGCDVERAKAICYSHLQKKNVYNATLYFTIRECSRRNDMRTELEKMEDEKPNTVVLWIKNGSVHKPARFIVDSNYQYSDDDYGHHFEEEEQ